MLQFKQKSVKETYSRLTVDHRSLKELFILNSTCMCTYLLCFMYWQSMCEDVKCKRRRPERQGVRIFLRIRKLLLWGKQGHSHLSCILVILDSTSWTFVIRKPNMFDVWFTEWRIDKTCRGWQIRTASVLLCGGPLVLCSVMVANLYATHICKKIVGTGS